LLLLGYVVLDGSWKVLAAFGGEEVANGILGLPLALGVLALGGAIALVLGADLLRRGLLAFGRMGSRLGEFARRRPLPVLALPPLAWHLQGGHPRVPVAVGVFGVLAAGAWLTRRVQGDPEPQAPEGVGRRPRGARVAPEWRALGRAARGLVELVASWALLAWFPRVVAAWMAEGEDQVARATLFGAGSLLVLAGLRLVRRSRPQETPADPDALPGTGGVSPLYLPEGDATDHARCPYCGAPLGAGPRACCPRCETPHHPDCWREAGRCTTFGCPGR